MPIAVLRSTARRLLTVGLVASGLIAAPSVAGAAPVTTSAITSITGTPTPYATYDSSSGGPGAPSWTVTGTTDGTTGTVDLVCSYGTSRRTLTTNVAVAADGSFTATAVVTPLLGFTCDLHAIPSGSSPSDLTPFAARQVGVGSTENYTYTSGVNSGTQYDYYAEFPGPRAFADYLSIGSCGLCDMRLQGSDLTYGSYLWYDNAALYRDVTIGGADRAYAIVDGQPAYDPDAVEGISPNAAGTLPLTFSSSVDPATGDAVVHESDPLVTCSTFPATSGGCPAFTTVPVVIDRTITQDHGGRVVSIVDELKSTDGASHSYDLQYENSQDAGTGNGYRFPGDSDYAVRANGDVIPGPSSAVSTVEAKYDATAAPSLANPVGSITVSPAPTAYTFTGAHTFFINEVGSVPAGGVQTIRQTFTMAESQSELDGQVTADEDAQQAPAVAITAPDGGVASAKTVTVSGTATALHAITGLTVDGAGVPVAADGTWSTPVTLQPGANIITATATNSGGRTATATRTITYTPPAAATTTTITAPPATTRAVPTRIAVATVKTRTGALTTPLTCTAAAGKRCSGRITVVARIVPRGGHATVPVRVGSATYSLAAGARRSYTIKLTKLGRALLARHRVLHVRIKVFLTSGSPAIATATLRAARKS